MSQKEKFKHLIDQLPDERITLIETMLKPLLQAEEPMPPTGKLELKGPFDRETLYEDILADRLSCADLFLR